MSTDMMNSSNPPVQTEPSAVFRDDLKGMHAYVVQDAAGMVKLDAMENPYRLSDAMQQRLGERLGRVAVNRYPGGVIDTLKQALANYVDLPSGMRIMLGNGSDELIALIALACNRSDAVILAPEPGFVMYAVSAQWQGLRYVGVPLQPDFSLDEAGMCDAITQHRPAVVYLANPNNPTANAWDPAVMRRIIKAAPGLVVVDEAYQPFADTTWLTEMRADPVANGKVLLMRTLSKFGLAGIRLGYMLGSQALISEIDKLRPPYNVSGLNAECALFALENAPVFAAQAAEIRAERAALSAALGALPGCEAFPSQANMILIRVPDATETFQRLKASGVLVKNVSTMHPLLHRCLRITVGTPQENALLLTALKAAL
jgi:histidinol-phosphate aminotransferase